MAILMIIAIILLVLLFGLLLAFVFSRLDRVVTNTRGEMAAEEKAYSPNVTLGHRIKVQAEYDAQLEQARQLAAKKAAALPRGANSRIGRAGESTLKTASENLGQDPQSAVRIARFHGWDGAKMGPTAAAVAAAPVVAAPGAAARPAAPAATVGIAPPVLIEITPTMSPEEVRKARIANSKAEAAYNKALKAAASGVGGVAVPPAAAAAVSAPAAAAAGVPAAAGIEPPRLIAITPDMPPEEVRKARVANAKAEAAYNKALKAAGVGAGTVAGVEAVVNAEMPGPATTAAHPAAPAPALAGIDPPVLIEITPTMTPDEVRKARIANSKAESAYNKALKASGIDPATLRGGAAAVATATTEPLAAQAAQAAAPPPVPAAPEASAVVAADIQPPVLIEITPDMPPDEVRRARVANAKAEAAYNKALKAAGIDPASVK